jgi:hypothetical protein
MITKILTDRAGYHGDIKELRNDWLRDLFLYIGLDVEGMDELSKSEILEYFLDNEVEIIEHKSIEGLEVRFEGELIGEWAGPNIVLKQDEDNSLYFEIEIEHWSIKEEEIDE